MRSQSVLEVDAEKGVKLVVAQHVCRIYVGTFPREIIPALYICGIGHEV